MGCSNYTQTGSKFGLPHFKPYFSLVVLHFHDLSFPLVCFFLFFLGITLVCENTKGEDEDEEPSQELVAGVQLAYSKKKPTRKVIAIL